MTRTMLIAAAAMVLLAMLLAGCTPCAMYCGDVYPLTGPDGRIWQAQYIVDNGSYYRVQHKGEVYRVETADMDAAVRQGQVVIIDRINITADVHLYPTTQPKGD